MTIRGFQVSNLRRQPGAGKKPSEKTSPEKVRLPSIASERLRKANEYFDKHPPRAHSKAELDDFLKQL